MEKYRRIKMDILKRISILILGLFVLTVTSCNNILDFESVGPCGLYNSDNSVRFWNSVDGLVRYDSQRLEYFIVAVFPGESDLSVLRACNIPQEFLTDRAPIRFFGNEFEPETVELVEDSGNSSQIFPFEITYIERVRR